MARHPLSAGTRAKLERLMRRVDKRSAAWRYLRAGIGRFADNRVAVRLGVGVTAVGAVRVQLGLRRSPGAPLRRAWSAPRSDADLVRRMRKLGPHQLSMCALATRLRSSPGRIRRLARMHGIGLRIVRTRRDWSRVDWSLPNEEIARSLGASPGGVAIVRLRLRRRGLRIPPSRGARTAWGLYSREDLESLAPRVRKLAEAGRTRESIVRSLRISMARLGAIVALFRVKFPVRRRGTDWAAVDWTRPNREIARIQRVSVVRVGSVRAALRKRGAPVPPSPDRSGPAHEARRRAYAHRAERLVRRIRPLADRGLNMSQIARRLRKPLTTVALAARWGGVEVRRARDVDWDSVDWTRSNKEIAADLDAHPGSVSLMRGKLRRAGRAIPRSPMPESQRRAAGTGWKRAAQRRWRELLRRARPLLDKKLPLCEVARRLGTDDARLRRALAWEDAGNAASADPPMTPRSSAAGERASREGRV